MRAQVVKTGKKNGERTGTRTRRTRALIEFSRRTEVPQERLSELFDYMLYGSVGVISGWLKNKDADDSAENIAARISRLSGAAIKLVLTD